MNDFETPCFVVDSDRLRQNAAILRDIRERASCQVLLALKGFAMWGAFPLIREALDGCCASGVHEAQLAHETFGKEVHAYAPAFSDADLRALTAWCHHISFNSLAQWQRYRSLGLDRVAHGPQLGLRINPQCSTAHCALYDPCAPGSRLGVLAHALTDQSLDGLTGLHFHTLCEQPVDALEQTLTAVEAKFGEWLPRMEWVNFGGGHHITRPDYDRDRLVELIRSFAERYEVRVYLEPGEAVALEAGVLVARVLDVVENDGPIAILDVSCTAHMPDVLEMPYRPRVYRGDDWRNGIGCENDDLRGAEPGSHPHTYRLGGVSCLAGDMIGAYSFVDPLQPGDMLVFEDMAHYTMVKTTTFNGVRHPHLALLEPQRGDVNVIRRFGYEDFKQRLS